jgi:hypothetical protein
MSAGSAVKPGGKRGRARGPSGRAASLAEVAFAELVRARQVSPLPVPLAGGATLPLGDLDPEVLERLAAEMIKRRLNDGSQFYGRRGQKQYWRRFVPSHTFRLLSQRHQDHQDLVSGVAGGESELARPTACYLPAEPGVEAFESHSAAGREMELLKAHLVTGHLPEPMH